MLTKEEAIKLYDSGWWKRATHEEIARFQFNQEKLCCPFDVFHEAVEKTIGRPVWTHEFAYNHAGLLAEINGESGPQSFEDILDIIPKDIRAKCLIVEIKEPQ